MKKSRLLYLLALVTMTMSSCGFYHHTTSEGPRQLVDYFVDTKGRTQYISLNQESVTLLPDQTFQFLMDIHEKDETPSYDGKYSGVEWFSVDPNIVTIDENGLVTAKSVGSTSIGVEAFTGIGKYASVNVLKKELLSIKLTNVRKTYLLNSEFTPSFKCMAQFKGNVEEEVTPTNIDSSKVDTSKEGTYEVKVSYTFEEKTVSAKYFVKVVDNPTYDPKEFSVTYNDVDSSSRQGWFIPRTGNVKGLVIPIWFANSNAFIDNKNKVISDLEKVFNGAEGLEGWNSVTSYYKKVSNNQVNLSYNISNWYECGKSSDDITNDKDVRDLVKSATEWYFTNHSGEKMSDYDSDNNGVFDALDIIYGVNDAANDNTIFWGKVIFNSAPVIPSIDGQPKVNFHMWMSATSLYEDVSHTEVDSHVFCHETGHMFGLSDYYDYGDSDYRPIAGGTMMFHNTHQQDPFSTLSLGWSKAIVPETSCVVELDDYQSSHTSLVLSANPSGVNSAFNEYIIAELYAPNGLNEFDSKYPWQGFYSKGAQQPGIRLWHVDARLAYLSGDTYYFTDDPTTPNNFVAMSNSFGSNHGSRLGEDYYDYCLLFELRNDKSITYKPTTNDEHCMFNDETLFHTGDVFTLEDYSKQFVDGPKLDCGESLGWKLSIESIYENGSGYKATLNLEQI